jgi:hypothetical protein
MLRQRFGFGIDIYIVPKESELLHIHNGNTGIGNCCEAWRSHTILIAKPQIHT